MAPSIFHTTIGPNRLVLIHPVYCAKANALYKLPEVEHSNRASAIDCSIRLTGTA
jgi:hypothetical protein